MDLHLVTANLLFDLGLTDEQMTESHPEYEAMKEKHKDARHKGKNGFNFPVVYGSTEHGIARNIGIKVAEAKRLLTKFLDQYPGIKNAINQCTSHAQCYGWVSNLAGRRRRFEEVSPRAVRQAFNFLIQGYAADMLRIGMIQMRQMILDHPEWEMKMVLTVHDEVVLEVKDECVEEAIPFVEDVMRNAVDLGIPVECEVGSGKKYSEAK
jgi:DNA polymerase-1